MARDSLFYELGLYGIKGKFLRAIRSLYQNTSSCVQVNDYTTEWFYINSGVKQGDNLSTSLFSLYINDLTLEITNLEKGNLADGFRISILLYADDIVILAQSAHDLHEMINVIYNWCGKWQMEVMYLKQM